MRGVLIVFLVYLRLVNGFGDIIYTTSGYVRGKEEHYGNTTYYSYLGIPYAEPPVGPLRFAPPIPKQPWNEIFNATADGPVCPQSELTYHRSEMSEDCLVINVYVPDVERGSIPVLVYVPGGDLDRLSGRGDYIYGPQLYMAQGVIVVTMNYRLGALGFLSVGTEDASGNAALKDILLSLTWVRDNIANFGGDAGNVTLGGNSAGAVLAHYLTLSEQATGLFQRAMLLSGSALSFRFLARYPLNNAIHLAKELGIDSESPEELLEKLRELDMFDIVEAQERLGVDNVRNGIRPFAPFAPCIEREYNHSVITRDPLDIVQDGIPQNVPILAGFNALEGIKMLPVVKLYPALLDNIEDNFELAIPTNILYPYGSQESKQLADSIKHFYFGEKAVSNDSIENYVKFIGDIHFNYAVDCWVRLHKARESSGDVFYYLFDFDGDLNWFKLRKNLTVEGTAHGDELGYSFVTNATKDLIETAGERSKQTMRNIVELWTNFVKYGEPTPKYLQSILPNWEKLEHGDRRKHLIISDQPKIEDSNPYSGRMTFWQEVYDQYHSYRANGGTLEPKDI